MVHLDEVRTRSGRGPDEVPELQIQHGFPLCVKITQKKAWHKNSRDKLLFLLSALVLDMDLTYSYSIVPIGTPAFETRSVP